MNNPRQPLGTRLLAVIAVFTDGLTLGVAAALITLLFI